jgi:hypothetical protein
VAVREVEHAVVGVTFGATVVVRFENDRPTCLERATYRRKASQIDAVVSYSAAREWTCSGDDSSLGTAEPKDRRDVVGHQARKGVERSLQNVVKVERRCYQARELV